MTPVANVDQATGDRAGYVVCNFLKQPFSIRLEKFCSLPSPINFLQRSGSRPSNPKITSRFTLALAYAFRRRNRPISSLNGRVSKDNKAKKNETKSARKDEIKAKPAPGPI